MLRLHSCFLLALGGFIAVAEAQSYPTKPVRIVSPFAAGGTGELIFRAIAPVLEGRLGQKLFLEARPGAGGNIGAEIVATAPADGHTLLLGVTTNFTVNPYLFAKSGFDAQKMLAPITVIADVPSVLYAHPSLPAENLQQLVSYAKSNPGILNYASAGNGTSGHLTMELLSQLAGIRMVHVPYKGLQPAMTAVLANDAQLYLAGLGAGQGLIRAGKLRALAVGSQERLPGIPAVPTMSESGFREFIASTRFVLAGPAATPGPIIERWSVEIQYALGQAEIRQRLADLAIIPVGNTPSELSAELRRDSETWSRVIRNAGVRAE